MIKQRIKLKTCNDCKHFTHHTQNKFKCEALPDIKAYKNMTKCFKFEMV